MSKKLENSMPSWLRLLCRQAREQNELPVQVFMGWKINNKFGYSLDEYPNKKDKQKESD